jgi:hypothetical protein
MLGKTAVHHFTGNNVRSIPDWGKYRMSCEGALMQALEDIDTLEPWEEALYLRLWRVTNGWLEPVIQIELGTACGKLFRCSTMAIIDAGDSDILSSQAA